MTYYRFIVSFSLCIFLIFFLKSPLNTNENENENEMIEDQNPPLSLEDTPLLQELYILKKKNIFLNEEIAILKERNKYLLEKIRILNLTTSTCTPVKKSLFDPFLSLNGGIYFLKDNPTPFLGLSIGLFFRQLYD